MPRQRVGWNAPEHRMFCSGTLARIIHQPEKSTGEGDFVVQMNPKTIVSQAYDAP
jgi:hypothetical protein